MYVVLGMHKSGTSLISQILHCSGINMVDNIDLDVSYDKGNKYERKSTKAINHEILNSQGLNSLDIIVPNKLEINFKQQIQIKEIIQNCNQKYKNWGFKDPRTCLTYPLWASELPEHKIIVIYRSVDELWQRYSRLHKSSNYYFTANNAYKLIQNYYLYNSKILDYLRNTKMDFLVLNYYDFMTKQKKFELLQDFIGIKLQDKRNISLYRHRKQKKITLISILKWLNYLRTGYMLEVIVKQLDELN